MLKFLSKLGPFPALGIQLAIVFIAIQLYFEFQLKWIFWIGAMLSVVLLFFSYKIKSFLEAIHTSKIRSVAVGLSEVKGKPVGETKLKSPLTKTACYAYTYQEQRKQRVNKSSIWVTTKSERKDGHLYLDDGTGQLLCDTKGATLSIKGITKYGFNIKKTETVISPSQNLFVIGSVKDNPFVKDATSVEGWKDLMMGDGEIYIISDKSEKNLRKWYAASVIVSGLSSFGLAIAGFLI